MRQSYIVVTQQGTEVLLRQEFIYNLTFDVTNLKIFKYENKNSKMSRKC